MNLLFLLLAGCAFVQLLSVRALDLKHLDEKLRQSKKEFIKIHIQNALPVQQKSYKLHWDKLWEISLKSENRLFAINMFNRTFILDGNQMMMPSFNETSDTSDDAKLHEVAQLGEYTTVKFVTSIMWKDTIYLLLCYQPNLCSLHTGMSNVTLKFRHTIKCKGVPVDAKFFTQDDQLYLIIVNNANKFPIASLIYRWSDTYMDVVEEVITSAVVSVIAFRHRRSTIIVFACHDAENPWIGSEVYEFKNDKITKIQMLFNAQPISMHNFIHSDFNFILMVNKQKSSNVFCWDGRELIDWSNFVEIKPHSLISIFHMDNGTFIIVAHKNIIELHKFHNISEWKKEAVKSFKKDQHIVNMSVSLNENIITVTLIMKQDIYIRRDNIYQIEQWQVKMSPIPIENIVQDVDITSKCLSDLIKTLETRMSFIREAKLLWKHLPFATEEPVKFDNLIVQSGNVDNIEIMIGADILPPHRIEKDLNQLDRNVNDLLLKGQKVANATTTLLLNNKIIVDELHVEDLEIDRVKVDYLNDKDVRSGIVIFSQDDQHFAHPLNVKNTIVDNLEVESLCGIPSEYWMFKNNETIPLNAVQNFVEYSNDSIIVHSDLTVPKLNITSLNNVIINELIDDLFIVNRTQKIKGKLVYKNLQIVNLTTQTLNDISTDKLMTKTTNQSFDNFYIKSLATNKLYAETINGVPVEEAARKSRDNVIKGKVKLATLHVTENFVIDVDDSQMIIPRDLPLQIYENVTILGDLHLKNLNIENAATLFVEDNGPVNVNCIFDKFWTKSSNQTITKEITLKGGFTIDRLRIKYFNGFAEDDFLYTTMEEIPSDFTNLHFENFYVDEFFQESEPNVSFFKIEPYSLKISKNLHLSNLRVIDMIISSFNDINVLDIMNGVEVNFSEILQRFPIVQANRVFVDDLDVRFVNDRKVILQDRLRVDNNHRVTVLKVPEFHVQNLQVENLNGIEMKLLTRLKESTYLDKITIDGDLTVKNLTIGQINGQTVASFLQELRNKDIVIPERSIEALMVDNITLKSLYGQNFDDFIASILSRSREQTIRGHFSAHAVTSENVTMNFINGRNASQLMWVDAPLTITGNVTFSDLYVEGDVITSRLNGRNVSELYDSLLTISASNIDLLKVNGDISWNMSRTSPTSISYLLENAVTTDTDQVITGNVTFENDVHAWMVNCSFDEISMIRDIISDAVIDAGNRVEITGKKFFENDFEANNLRVNDDLGVHEINGVDIRKFNDSVVRKDLEDTIVGPLTFLKDVKINKLRVNNADLNASIDAAARSNAILPDNIFFEDLSVIGDVHLKNLDGVHFDRFMSQRITLSGDNEIPCNVQFNGVVTVTDNANIKKINGIQPSEFVLNNANEVQEIYGEKSFKEDLIIEGDVTAPQINNINIIKEYENGVKNDDEYVDIFGNLIFKSDVKINQMNTSGLVNGLNLPFTINNLRKKTNKIVGDLEERWQTIKQRILYSSQISKTLRNIFFYLETEEDLTIHGTNISNIDVTYLDNEMIKLDMKNEQLGRFCELPDHCSCPYQSTVELSNKSTFIAWRLKHGEIVKRFYDQDDNFEINVMTTAVSSSVECSLKPKREYTTISILRRFQEEPVNIVVSDDIEGYLRDATIFKHKGDIYVILAMNYDKMRATHRVNSLFYKVDVETENATLIQELPTHGAWSIQVFEIEQREMFLLIGCFGESAKSLLYRFDPTIRKFEQLRTFASKSRYVKNLSQGKDHFVLLDNPDTNAVNIYKYDPTYRNFYSYQNIFLASEINGIEYFYADAYFDNSDAFVIVTTRDGRFYIYEYMLAEKFQLKLQHALEGVQTMVPFYYVGKHYILAGTSNNNVMYRIVKQGPH